MKKEPVFTKYFVEFWAAPIQEVDAESITDAIVTAQNRIKESWIIDAKHKIQRHPKKMHQSILEEGQANPIFIRIFGEI